MEDKVNSGLYSTASEVVREGLRLLKEKDTLDHLRAEVMRAVEQSERGESKPLDIEAIKSRGRKRVGASR